jgi:hypothetical protein
LDIIQEYLEFITAIIGFIAGCGVTLTVQKFRQGSNSSYSDQRNSRVGGDQAGRDIRKS